MEHVKTPIRDIGFAPARSSTVKDPPRAAPHYVHFFASPETGRVWVADHPGTFLLSLDDAFEVAQRAWPDLFRQVVPVGRPTPRERTRAAIR